MDTTTNARVPTGLVIDRPSVAEMLVAIGQAETRGVPAVWSTIAGIGPDPLTVYGAAAVQTHRINLGTAIIPTYPRHPAALAAQVLALDALAPGRLRLGLGPSHQFIIRDMYGLAFDRPLEHLREYLTVLRGLLWEGAVDYKGTHYRVKARLAGGTPPPRVPLPISALRAPAFRLAGEIADGAISWLCPVPYLLETAVPALREGAASAGRPVPPLIGHILVAMHTDADAVRHATRAQFGRYARAVFYARMFADAGVPAAPDGTMPDALVDALVVSGDATTVTARLRAIHAAGVDELLVSPVTVTDGEQEVAALSRLLAGLGKDSE
ncbi:MAG TPA: LLM class flavin-dependent oxidoreductase [Chloroflexia bacterium]|nr:LLM class flavin-dependent oxidoreductase [Chloroflexia bacterium]